MSKSSLSSVVSGLVRASMGVSVSSTVTNEDLDRHVAELILKEAKQKAEQYRKDGFRAYLPSGGLDGNAPRTNKRFLTSIIRSTDDHNKTILRAQAQAAQDIKKEREEQERRERRARAEEAAAAERMRRSKRSRRHDEGDTWDRGKDRHRKRGERSWERYDNEDEEGSDRDRRRESDKRRRRHRSRSAERSNRKEERCSRHRGERDEGEPRSKRKRDDSQDSSGEREHRRSRHHSDSDRHSRRRHHSSCSRSPRPRSASPTSEDDSRRQRKSEIRAPEPNSDEDSSNRPLAPRSPSRNTKEAEERESELRRRLKGKLKETKIPRNEDTYKPRRSDRTRSQTPENVACRKTASSSRTASTSGWHRSPSVSPPPLPSQLPSKMDKYFEESYDPRLDVAPLAAPKVPTTGLIDNAEFEGWDAMLELIRLRREDKEDKKRMERLGLGKDKIKSGVGSTKEGPSIMDIEYKKKGSVREWDLGKDGF